MKIAGRLFKILVALAIGLGSFLSLADEESQLEDFVGNRTVVLPPYFVQERRVGAPWRYTSAPGVEVISRCPDGTTREFVETFLIRDVELRAILPRDLQFEHSVPTAVILITPEMAKAMNEDFLYYAAFHPAAGLCGVCGPRRSTALLARTPPGQPDPPAVRFSRHAYRNRDTRQELSGKTVTCGHCHFSGCPLD